MKGNLRHLRLVLAVEQTGSVTRAADMAHVSQPAVTAALAGIEAALGTPLFDRKPGTMTPTTAGAVATLRIRRALGLLDPALTDLSSRLTRTTTMAKLTALIAVVETENFSAAARLLGLSQPTVHRAISQMEAEVGHALFERSNHGVIPVRAVRHLASAARLALAELDQAQSDIAGLAGREVGRVVIGAMPLSRSVLLGPAIALFRTRWSSLTIRVIEGSFPELVLGLRRGEIDMLVGALRPPVEDLVQTKLLLDEMAVVARPQHPVLSGRGGVASLADWPFVVAAQGTPARGHFQAMFQGAGVASPASLVETGSMALLTDLVRRSDHLGFVSARQVRRDLAMGTLALVPVQPQGTARPIGLITRQAWVPTRAQSDMIAALTEAAQGAAE